MGCARVSPIRVWLFRPIRGPARCAGHPRFSAFLTPPVCDGWTPGPGWPRQERRFLKPSLRQARLTRLSGQVSRRRSLWLDAAVAPNQPRRVRGGGQHPAQRTRETPDQERRNRDELQFTNHGLRLLRRPAVHTRSRLREFLGSPLNSGCRWTGGRPNGSAHGFIAAAPWRVR